MLHDSNMSIAEIESELKKLSPAKLAVVEALLQQIKAAENLPQPPETMARFIGCARGMMTFHPGWEESELSF